MCIVEYNSLSVDYWMPATPGKLQDVVVLVQRFWKAKNSILIYAKTTSGGTSQIGDIVSQKGRSTFKVITADGTADCLLKGSAVSAAGECTITATDSGDFTYYVTKISSHRCTVTQGTGTQFETGQSVPWTFGSAVNGVSVKIPNA